MPCTYGERIINGKLYATIDAQTTRNKKQLQNRAKWHRARGYDARMIDITGKGDYKLFLCYTKSKK